MDYVKKTMSLAKRSNCLGDTTFFQAIEEVLVSIKPLIKQYPKYLHHNIIERIIYPNREIRFKIEWLDDNNRLQVNNGYAYSSTMHSDPTKAVYGFTPRSTRISLNSSPSSRSSKTRSQDCISVEQRGVPILTRKGEAIQRS